MNTFDFIYNIENDRNYFEADDPEKVETKKRRRTTADLAIKNESKYNSYSFLALNMFRSCYSRYIFGGISDEKKAMDLLNQLRSTICRNVTKKAKKIAFDELMPQAKWYNLSKDASIKRLPKPPKPKEIDALEEKVKWMTADPLSKTGKEVRESIGKTFGVGEAKMVGYNGEIVTKWSINLMKMPRNIQELETEISSDIIRKKKEEEENKNKEEVVEKSTFEKDTEESIKKEKEPKYGKEDIKNVLNKISGSHLKELEGSSKKVSKVRNMVTNFIISILKNSQKDDILRNLIIYGKGPGGSYTGEELTSTEYVYANAAKIIINGIAYEVADIAVRGLIEIEVLNAVKICKDGEDIPKSPRIKKIKHYHDTDFIPFDEENYKKIAIKIKQKLRTMGITEMPSTLKLNLLKWIKIADIELENSGFDDHIRDEICYYFKLYRGASDSIFKHSPRVKTAIERCTDRIVDYMLEDNQFLNSMTTAIIDIEKIKNLFAEIDPDLAERMDRKRRYIYKKEKEEDIKRIKSLDSNKTYDSRKHKFTKPNFSFKRRESEKPENIKENNIISFYEFIKER